MVLKCYNSVAEGLKLKFRKFWGLTFVEVTGGKLEERPFLRPILNRVKAAWHFG